MAGFALRTATIGGGWRGRMRRSVAGVGLALCLSQALSLGPAGQVALAEPGVPALTVSGSAFTGDQVLRGLFAVPLADGGRQVTLINLEGAVAPRDGSHSLQAGLIHRHRLAAGLMLGGTGFAAFDRSAAGSGFASVSPGVELLAPRWQLSANLYLPVGDRTKVTGAESWAGEAGQSGYIRFRGHQQFDRRIASADQVGPGVDLSASVALNLDREPDLRLAAGGYHFDQAERNRSGATAGVEVALGHGAGVGLGYVYDSLDRHRVGLTLRFQFGGAPARAASGTGPEWHLRPAQRNVGTLGQANTMPITHDTIPVSGDLLYRDNIWFFDPGGGVFDPAAGGANCSYERPCASLDPVVTRSIDRLAAVGGYRDAPSLYLGTGSYSLPAGALVQLFGNQSLLGRSADYVTPAVGDARPVLLAGGILVAAADGNQANQVADLVLRNNGSFFPAAIMTGGTGLLVLDNLDVGLSGQTPAGGGFLRGLSALDTGRLVVTGSRIFAGNGGDPFAPVAMAVQFDGAGTLSLQNSQLTASASGPGNRGAIALLQGGAAAAIDNSSLSATVSGTGSGRATGILAAPGPGGSISLDRSDVTATVAGDGNAGSRAILLQGAGGGGIVLRDSRLLATNAGENGFGAVSIIDGSTAGNDWGIATSTITAGATGGGNAATVLLLAGDATARIDASVLDAGHSSLGDSGIVTQVQLFDRARLVITRSTITAHDESSEGVAAANNFLLSGDSRLVLAGSTVISTGSAATQSGSTNITTLDRAVAIVTDSDLVTRFGGGPLVTQASGAVPLWSLDSSVIEVLRSTVTAVALNPLTGSTPIEAEGNSRVTVTDSTVLGIQDRGNLLPISLETVVAAGNARVDLSGSIVGQRLAEPSRHGLILLSGLGTSRITVQDSLLLGDNAGTPLGTEPLQTTGVSVIDTSAITLRRSPIVLRGGEVRATSAVGGGTVTVAK